MFMGLIIAVTFTKNVYEAEKMARLYIGNINLILLGAVPILTLVIGKIRKVL